MSPSEREAARVRLSAEDELAAVVAELGTGVEIETDMLFNEPAEGVLAASRHVDMLIMGSRALGPKRAVLLGSVSRKAHRGRDVSCVVLPRGAGRRPTRCSRTRRAQAAGAS